VGAACSVLAMSSDGKVIYAQIKPVGQTSCVVYVSYDTGVTFTPLPSAGIPDGVTVDSTLAMSSSGNRLVAIRGYGKIYISSGTLPIT
jgi:hypothetical protein